MFTYPMFSGIAGATLKSFQATCNADATNHVLDTPSGIEVGELLVVMIGYFTGGNTGTKERWETVSIPAGWTKAIEACVTQVGVVVFWKIADGTEGSSTTFTSVITVDSCARYARISGYNADRPITSIVQEVASATSIVTSPVYAEGDNSLGLHLSAMDDPHVSTIDTSGTDWVDQGITQTGLTTADVQTQFLTKELSEGEDVSITTATGGIAEQLAGVTVVVNSNKLLSSYTGPTIADYTYNGTLVKATSVVLTAPSGITAGDLLVVTGHQDNPTAGDDFSTPAGFTEIGQNGGSASDCHVGMWYKVAVGGEGNVTLTSSFSNAIAGSYIRITGANATTPLDSSSERAEDAVTTNNYEWWTPGNSTAANCLSILIGTVYDDAYMTITGPRYSTLINQPYDAGFTDGTCVAVSTGHLIESGVNGGPVWLHKGDPSTQQSIVMMANFKA